MCTLSMVIDHFDQRIPGGWTWPPRLSEPAIDLAELRRLINEFREAVDAAKTVDRLTGQPDCVDPEKAKLQERVERLEKVVDALLAERR